MLKFTVMCGVFYPNTLCEWHTAFITTWLAGSDLGERHVNYSTQYSSPSYTKQTQDCQMHIIRACYHGNWGETWGCKCVWVQLFVNYKIVSELFFVSDWEKSVNGIHPETEVVFEDVWAFNHFGQGRHYGGDGAMPLGVWCSTSWCYVIWESKWCEFDFDGQYRFIGQHFVNYVNYDLSKQW